jgi:hypothetical protein
MQLHRKVGVTQIPTLNGLETLHETGNKYIALAILLNTHVCRDEESVHRV